MSSKIMLHGFPVKEGDRVWSLTHGWGAVKQVLYDSTTFPIIVALDSGGIETFTVDGFYLDTHKNPTLFWNEVVLEIPAKPCPPVYEYKILFVRSDGEHDMTTYYYTSFEEYQKQNGCGATLLSLYEPSKRVRKP